MATIRLIEEREASPDVKTVYDDIKRRFSIDFVPNVFKALAHRPEVLKQAWEDYKNAEDEWGKEKIYLISLTVDVTNGCKYCINFDTALLKQVGYDDAKIEKLINYIANNNFYNKYVDGLDLEPDVTPAAMEAKKAA